MLKTHRLTWSLKGQHNPIFRDINKRSPMDFSCTLQLIKTNDQAHYLFNLSFIFNTFEL